MELKEGLVVITLDRLKHLEKLESKVESLQKENQKILKLKFEKKLSDEMVQDVFNQLNLHKGVLEDINKKATEMAEKILYGKL